ncbi:coiled-coil-helix-coiled-coil-helix domain-containing protein 7 isoform X2 [Zootermopsis nevadensis]|uniref:coiled-coil-helix-coiled-coil-helix domain-containing protein 7 isoform X2 n=1 Tax=Zootermopsis nevadensis TaxID=136037 RepID=UPI000B8E514F|nr:coiled-coil-helix-coiled-coil-helix domain-containing protein 7 isoform X2 [Zootermopsis nevadensis]
MYCSTITRITQKYHKELHSTSLHERGRQENDMVFKCLENNNYQHDKCTDYFQNYNSCKTFWGKIRAERRQQGKVPHLPPLEEREKIRAHYVTSKKSANT